MKNWLASLPKLADIYSAGQAICAAILIAMGYFHVKVIFATITLGHIIVPISVRPGAAMKKPIATPTGWSWRLESTLCLARFLDTRFLTTLIR